MTPSAAHSRAEVAVSFAQERRFHAPTGCPVWNIPFALGFEGPLDRALLERCLGEIVQRHHVLRSEICTRDGRPVLTVRDPSPLRLPVIDLESRGETTDDRERRLLELRIEEACIAFDFPRAPLFRFQLLRTGSAYHVLLLTFHHSVFDGRWSLAILMRELAILYEALEQGQRPQLAELALQYHDYSRSERLKYQGAAHTETLAHWRSRFADAPRVLALPTDHHRPPLQTFRGASHTITLPGPVTQAVKSLSRKEGATPFMVLMAAFKMLLYHAAGQTKVIVGTAIATRNQQGARDVIGNFVNFLPVLTDLSANPSFRVLLARVRTALLDAYADPELPFELLTELLDPACDASRPALCQVFFAWHGPPPPPLQFSGIAVELLHSGILTRTCKKDLHVHLAQERENEIRIETEYCTDLFEPATIARLLAHYRHVLELVVAHPDEPIDSLVGRATGEQPR